MNKYYSFFLLFFLFFSLAGAADCLNIKAYQKEKTMKKQYGLIQEKLFKEELFRLIRKLPFRHPVLDAIEAKSDYDVKQGFDVIVYFKGNVKVFLDVTTKPPAQKEGVYYVYSSKLFAWKEVVRAKGLKVLVARIGRDGVSAPTFLDWIEKRWLNGGGSFGPPPVP